jgi:hypothetical protein
MGSESLAACDHLQSDVVHSVQLMQADTHVEQIPVVEPGKERRLLLLEMHNVNLVSDQTKFGIF